MTASDSLPYATRARWNTVAVSDARRETGFFFQSGGTDDASIRRTSSHLFCAVTVRSHPTLAFCGSTFEMVMLQRLSVLAFYSPYDQMMGYSTPDWNWEDR